MLTYKIHLIRHGLTKANFERRYIGVTDEPLCEEGINRLHRLMEENEYPGTQLVYSSPLLRAVQTAQLIYPDSELQTVDELRELDFGAFENRMIEDLEQDEDFRAWIASPDQSAPGGESGVRALQRAAIGLEQIFIEMMEQKITSAAVICHSGIMSGLLSMLGLPQRESIRWQCDPGAGFTLLVTPQMWMRDRKFEVYSKIPLPPEDAQEPEDEIERRDMPCDDEESDM